MKVTEKDVAHVAALANLELTATERERMLRDLNSILDYVGCLNELDTANVPPMAQVSDRLRAQSGGQENESLRDDVREGLRKSLSHEEAMRNAPATDGTFFEVPKVIER